MKRNNVTFSLEYFYDIDENRLLELIKSVSFNRTKVHRIKSLTKYIMENYNDLENFFSLDLYDLRKELLKIKGIGKETSDVITLYSAEKPIFVVDSYTRKLLFKFGFVEKTDLEYDIIRAKVEDYVKNNLNRIIKLFREELEKIDCVKKLEKIFNYAGGSLPLNPCDLNRSLSEDEKLVIIYKELHAMIDIYMKRLKKKNEMFIL